jgi:N-methylhydantoinase B
MKTDPVTFEVLRNAFVSVAEEMGAALVLTAFSPNIKERRDCSAAVFDSKGRMISQAEHIPVHLGAMPESVKAALTHLPPDQWNAGDVVILNDPFEGGTHLPDITLISPVFASDSLVGFIANRAHHADVGGKTPGSMPGDSTEIYQEGIRIPPLKLIGGGALNQDMWRLLLANVRTPLERQGDLRAQLAANTTGLRRFQSILHKHGVQRVKTFFEDLLRYSKRRMLQELAKMPKGSYGFRDFLDDDGITEEAVELKVKITLTKKQVIFDFSGTSPQRQGNVNATLAVTLSTSYYVLRCITDPTIPPNAGCYEPLSVIAPPGSLLNPLPPAAVSAGNVETAQRIVDCLFGALAKALPDRIPAASQGTMNNLAIGGPVPGTTRAFTFYETIGGGLGARPTKDGIDGIHSHMTNTLNTPIEALETSYPLRVRCYHLIPRSEGAGEFRGGMGIQRDIEILADRAVVSIQSERRRYAPWGLRGGAPGRMGVNRCWRAGKWERLPGKITFTASKGDIVSIQTPGGGGFGQSKNDSSNTSEEQA